jgi:hypothetical protein
MDQRNWRINPPWMTEFATLHELGLPKPSTLLNISCADARSRAATNRATVSVDHSREGGRGFLDSVIRLWTVSSADWHALRIIRRNSIANRIFLMRFAQRTKIADRQFYRERSVKADGRKGDNSWKAWPAIQYMRKRTCKRIVKPKRESPKSNIHS